MKKSMIENGQNFQFLLNDDNGNFQSLNRIPKPDPKCSRNVEMTMKAMHLDGEYNSLNK